MTKYLKDGFSTRHAFAEGALSVEEVETTPPGVDGGDGIDQTSMANNTFRTEYPRALKTITPGGCRVKYKSDSITAIIAQVNVVQKITTSMPDGTDQVWWGWIKSFIPDGLTEGGLPTANMEMRSSGMDNADAETGIGITTTT